jgi:hypothetical protein
MALTKAETDLINRYPDLKEARMRCLARRRTALARLAALPERGGSKSEQLARWTAKHSLRCEDPTMYVRAAQMREDMYRERCLLLKAELS